MYELADQDINLARLNQELALLNLPGFTGVARLSRRLVKGAWEPCPRYLLIKCGTLTTTQRSKAKLTVAAHVPTEPAPQSRGEELQRKVRDSVTLSDGDRSEILEFIIQRKW